MYTFWIHLVAFWQVVVMNCIQPANWQYCIPVHEWLLPELSRGIEIYLDKNHDLLYKLEREHLKDNE